MLVAVDTDQAPLCAVAAVLVDCRCTKATRSPSAVQALALDRELLRRAQREEP